MRRSLSLLLAISCVMPVAAMAQDAVPTRDIFDRSVKGQIDQPGGARRVEGDRTSAYRSLIVDGKPMNVILLIGDGMGDSEITAARNYAEGAGGYFKGIDALPISGHYTHYSLDKDTGKPNYVTDSAASATAWSIGVKSYNGAIGVDLRGQPHMSLLKLAKAAGLATGDVSTAAIQDATPAAQIANVVSRRCYSPESTSKGCAQNALENGGAGSISEQLLDTRPDVTLGGGFASFQEKAKAGRWKGKTLLQQAQTRGYTIIRSADELTNVHLANDKKPLLGLFSDDNMPVRWEGPKASKYGNLEKPVVECQLNPERTANIPTLAAMTTKAIDLLKNNPKGFFLQVEGASIDKENHAANPCGQIGETVDLDEAVQVALKFAREHGNTLVIVTADHAHTSQIISNGSRAPGLTLALKTKDDAVMTMNYGTAETGSQGHTGTQLRIAAYGPQAANVTGLSDQTDLFYTIRDALGLKQDGTQ